MEAAKILGCSYLDLDSHPDKLSLMEKAFTYSEGKGKGEYMRALNPKYQRMQKQIREELERAQK
jgi:hypothetical protein